MSTISRIWGAVGHDVETAADMQRRVATHWAERCGSGAGQFGRWGSLGATTMDSGISVSVGGDSVEVAVDGVFFDRDISPSPAAIFAGLYVKKGFVGALESVSGDFAVAVHDVRSGELWLGRDRAGVRPMFYALAGGGLAFASQPCGLTGLPCVGREVNRRFVALFAASHYRTFDNLPEESPYSQVRQLPVAHRFGWHDGTIRTAPYWKLSSQPDLNLTEEELAKQYRELLLDAVGSRMRHAPERAFSLSGGMDSSSVLSCGVRLTGEKQPAFSTVYADRTYDESEDIQTILESTVSKWHTVDVSDPDVFSLIDRMVATNDEPVATATWLSHYQLCENAALAGFPALFIDLGGDELNAGEYEYFFFFFADLLACGKKDQFAREVDFWAKYHDHAIYKKNRAVAEEGIARMTDPALPGLCLPDRPRLMRYAGALNPEYFDLETFEPVMDRVFYSYLKNRTYQDIFRETAPCCQRAQDRHGAHFGVAHINPFYDHRLMELMFRIPGTLKIRDGVTKHLLREAMRGIVPESMRTRIKKTVWNAPAPLWFSGKGAERLLDVVASQTFKDLGIYKTAEVERIIREHRRIVSQGLVEENHMMFLWQVANLQAWLGRK
jgi:asparagine synthase (glutamine-hydrolysing)